MHTLFSSFSSALFALTLTGCATMMSKKTCLTTDWYSKGYSDGTTGAPSARYSLYENTCRKHDISIDHRDRYMSGWEAGLNTYCSPVVAYMRGREGHTYNGVCKDKHERQFLDAYFRGLETYATTQAFERLRVDLYHLNRQLDAHIAEYKFKNQRLNRALKSIQNQLDRIGKNSQTEH